MAATRKLQGEIDRCLKKVMEGVETFEDIWQKVHNATNSNQKEKYEADLKKEIKKLQRLRDQIKSWIASAEIKDKSYLMENRKLIETQMERFKVVERETKTKAYSKEGLGAAQKLDPAQIERERIQTWLVSSIDSLNIQCDSYECEVESLLANKKKKLDKDKQEKMDEYKSRLEKHRFHIRKLETLLRMLDNMSVEVSQIKNIKDDVEYYIESSQEPDFNENEYLYDDIIGLDEVELSGVGLPSSATTDSNETAGTPTSIISGSSPIASPVSMSVGCIGGGGAPYNHSSDSSNEEKSKNNVFKDTFKPIKPMAVRASSTTLNSSTNSLLNSSGASSVTSITATPNNMMATCLGNTTPNNTSSSSGSKQPVLVSSTPSKSSGLSLSGLQPLTSSVIVSSNSSNHSSSASAQQLAQLQHTMAQMQLTSSSGMMPVMLSSSLSSMGMAATAAGSTTVASSRDSSGSPPPPTSQAQQVMLLQQQQQQLQQQQKGEDVAAVVAAMVTASTVTGSNSGGKTISANSTEVVPVSVILTNSMSNLTVSSQITPPVSNTTQLPHHPPTSLSTSLVNSNTSNNSVPKSSVAFNNDHHVQNNNCTSPVSSVSSRTSPLIANSISDSAGQNLNTQPIMNGPTIDKQISDGMSSLKSIAQQAIDRAGLTSSPLTHPPQQQQVLLDPSPKPPPTAKSEANIPPLLGVAPLGAVPLQKEHQSQFQMMEGAYYHMPVAQDSERIRAYLARTPVHTPHYYIQTPLPHSDSLEFYQRLGTETLFFVFYYMEGTKAQYLAAKALKKQSWRFHTKYMMWFQRHEEPKIINEEYEQGTYIYFDYEKWGQRKKEGFTFEYKFLEDRDLN